MVLTYVDMDRDRNRSRHRNRNMLTGNMFIEEEGSVLRTKKQ
jgi:hypothetical protein